MKSFYSHLIKYDDLISEIEKLSLEKNHKKELCDLIDNLFHNLVLDTTLSNLEEEHKLVFFKMTKNQLSPDLIIEFLTKNIKDYDTILKFEIDKLKEELLTDLKQAQELGSKY